MPFPGHDPGFISSHGTPVRREDQEPAGGSDNPPRQSLRNSTDSEILHRQNVLMYLSSTPCQTTNAPPTGNGGATMGTTHRPLGHGDPDHTNSSPKTPVVAGGREPAGRSTIPTTQPGTGSYHRCIPTGLGGPLRTTPSPRSVVDRGAQSPHQRVGAESYPPDTEELPTYSQRTDRTYLDRQHDGHVLRTQGGRNQVNKPLYDRPGPVGMGTGQRCVPTSFPHSRPAQYRGRRPQQDLCGVPRVGTVTGGDRGSIPPLGHPSTGSVCHNTDDQMSTVRLQVLGTRLRRERTPDGLAERHATLRLSSTSSDCSGSSPDSPLPGNCHPHRPGVGTTDLVHRAAEVVEGAGDGTAEHPHTTAQEPREPTAPGPRQTEPACLAPEWLEFGHLNMGEDCMAILGAARAPSTTKTYYHKWKRFCIWAQGEDIHPVLCEPQEVLPYLLGLAESGLQHASIRTHLAAITRYKKRPGVPSLFTAPVISQFLKGLLRTFPPVRRPTPQWELNVVLTALMKPPFEPLHATDLRSLTLKTIFLVAITSARRVSELQALSVAPPFLAFHKDKVILRTHPLFVPKVVSDFHLNSTITLPVFFPEAATPAEKTLHTLDVRRTLKHYLNRTAGFRKTDQLFVSFAGATKGAPISKQGLARWLVACIKTAYTLVRRPLPGRVTAHSTRGKATTTAFLANVPLLDICKAATWQSRHVFTRHYCVDKGARGDAAVGQAALKNLFR